MAGKFGLRLGSGGAAYDTTVGIADFARMRRERLAKAQAALKKNKISAALLLRPENIRYVTGTLGPDFIEHLRYTIAFAEHEPILFAWGGKPLGDAPWLKPENARLAIHWASESPGREATWEAAKRSSRDCSM